MKGIGLDLHPAMHADPVLEVGVGTRSGLMVDCGITNIDSRTEALDAATTAALAMPHAGQCIAEQHKHCIAEQNFAPSSSI